MEKSLPESRRVGDIRTDFANGASPFADAAVHPPGRRAGTPGTTRRPVPVLKLSYRILLRKRSAQTANSRRDPSQDSYTCLIPFRAFALSRPCVKTPSLSKMTHHPTRATLTVMRRVEDAISIPNANGRTARPSPSTPPARVSVAAHVPVRPATATARRAPANKQPCASGDILWPPQRNAGAAFERASSSASR